MEKPKSREKTLGQFLRCPVFVTQSSSSWENPTLNDGSSGRLLGPQNEELQCFWDGLHSGKTDIVRDLLSQYPNLVTAVGNDKNSPIHVAVLGKYPDLVKLLLSYEEGKNAVDAEGNAALHLAATENQAELIGILLEHDVDLHVKNSSGDTPLHAAVRSGSFEAVSALLENSRTEVDEKGWKGETALHIAAALNRVDCARALVSHFAQTNLPSDTGERPIHRAADCGSTEVLRYLLDLPGCLIEQLLRMTDDEDSTPLHLAVNSADRETVRVLLEHDAPIDAQMFELSTPLHLACAQGFTEIVQLLHTFNVVEFDRVVRMKDGQGMTPMHRAAMFNFWGLLRILSEKRASINSQDGNGRSVLVLAASCGAWDSVSELLNCGADPFLCSDDGQNFLHLVVALGGNPETFRHDIRTPEKFVTLLNGRDKHGVTPLHIAARSGFGKTCETLVKLGGKPTVKDELLRTPLHLAAANGRYNTVIKLLSSLLGVGIMNETDSLGMTPLHLAAQKGHVKVVSLLISKGALMLRDFHGQLPLHLACASDQEDTAKVILSAFPLLINAPDKEDNLSLHCAAENNAFRCVKLLLDRGSRLELNDHSLSAMDLALVGRHKAAATAFVESARWREILLSESTLYHWPVLGLVEQLPSVMLRVLDKSQAVTDVSPHSKSFAVTYDFEMLEPSLANTSVSSGKKKSPPLEVANHMVCYRRADLLNHPVCSSYLDTKWLTYGIYFHILTLLLYVVFVTFLTYLVLVGIESELRPHLKDESMRRLKKYLPDFNGTRLGPVSLVMEETENTALDDTLLAVAVAFAALNLGLKVFQLIQQVQSATQLLRESRKRQHADFLSLLWEVSARTGQPGSNAVHGHGLRLSLPQELIRTKESRMSTEKSPQARWTFFLSLMNWFELTLYFTTLVFCVGFYDEADYYMSWESQWLVGSVAIFFAWVNLFFYLQRYGEVGVHVIILLKVMKTLVEAMCVFFVVVVAFSLTFNVLDPIKILPNDALFYNQSHDSDKPEDIYYTSYSTLQTSILRVSDQMVGDADVIVNFIAPILNKFMVFPRATYFFAMLSIGVITMLLQSLVVGFALGDILDVKDSLTFRRKAMQVALHTEIEEKLPSRLLALVRRPRVTVYPNRIRSRFVKGAIQYLTDKSAKTSDGTLPKKEASWEQQGSAVREELVEQTRLTEELFATLEQQKEMFGLMTRQLGMQTDGDANED